MVSEKDTYICACQNQSRRKNKLTYPDSGLTKDGKQHKLSFDCGERCINRWVSTECYVKTCPANDFCQNRRFQMYQYSNVYPVKTKNKGWGLCAGEPLKKGVFVMEYVGEIFSTETEFGQKRMEMYAKSNVSYLMKSSASEVIDATEYGNMARFINHSWDPNCETQKWNVLGEIWVGIFTLRDINVGEELNFDYQFDCFNTPYSRWYCGSDNCKGFLGIRPINKDQEKELEDNLACKICKKAKDNEILPDGTRANEKEGMIKGLDPDDLYQRVSLFTYSKSHRIEDPMYILCFQCKYSFHIKCITPKITKKKLHKDDFEYFWKSCKKKNRIKRKSKKKSSQNLNSEITEENPITDSYFTEQEDKTRKEDYSDEGIVIIEGVGEGDEPKIKEPCIIKSSIQKFKVIIDPDILHDDDMHGGKESIQSTIYKPKSENLSEKDIELVDQFQVSANDIKMNKSDDMDVDENSNFEQESSIIKILKSNLIEVKSANESNAEASHIDEEVQYDPHYANLLDELVRQEFEQLEKEIEAQIVEKEIIEYQDSAGNICIRSKRSKKPINFLHLLQKRLKKRISSRKNRNLALYGEYKGKAIPKYYLDSTEEIEDVPMKKSKSTKLPLARSNSQKLELAANQSILKKPTSRRRLHKIIESPSKLSKVKEESNEESEYSVNPPREFKPDNPVAEEDDILCDEDMPESAKFLNHSSDKDSDMDDIIDTKIKIFTPDGYDVRSHDDSDNIEDEVQQMFTKSAPTGFEDKRRPSSISDTKVKAEKLNDLLDEDDKDIELLEMNNNQQLQRPMSVEGEKPKWLLKDSISNSSMSIGSESSSDDKIGQFTHTDEQKALSHHSYDIGEESDLLKEDDEDFDRRENSSLIMQKSLTTILPPIRKLADTKKNVSGIDKFMKEHENNDRLRDAINKKHIMDNFNKIKAKTYNLSDYVTEKDEQSIGTNSEKRIYVMHVTESELKIIRKNRNLLLDLGAKLFWDHKYENMRNDHPFFHHAESLNEKKIKFQISGNFTEVYRARDAIIFLLNYERKIEKEQVVVVEITMWVPKILIKKVIGYQEKNINYYYKKFDVSISYNPNFINDESYPIQEETEIKIKGKKAFAEIVSSDINEKVSQLIVRTIHLAPADCKYLKEKICQLKCRIDPAELRICRTTKQQKIINMNHPFFHIPAYYKEVLIIGDKAEVHKAETEIYKFLREEKTNNQNIYTLSILIPFTIQPEEYNSYVDRIKERYLVDLQTYDPIPPRKHPTAMLVGTWDNISLAKDMMVEWIEKQRNIQMSRWNDYDNFEKMILNQQIRFTYKSLKRYIIEKHVKYLKYWDLTSHTVVRELPDQPVTEHDKEGSMYFDLAKGEADSLKYFMKHVDSETAINILFATNSQSRDPSHSATFNKQNDFWQITQKYDLDKKEILKKWYELLFKNMREYNFMSSHSRYSDSQYAGSGINEGYGYS